MPEEELIELRFRLYDGSDIGPFHCSPAATVATLKDRVISQWPKDKKIVPKSAGEIKLINSGKILENGRTVSQCKVPFNDLPEAVMTMHVVVQAAPARTKPEKMMEESPRKSLCSCSIM